MSDVGRDPLPVVLSEGTLDHGGQCRGSVGSPIGGAAPPHGPGGRAKMAPAPRTAGSPSSWGGGRWLQLLEQQGARPRGGLDGGRTTPSPLSG